MRAWWLVVAGFAAGVSPAAAQEFCPVFVVERRGSDIGITQDSLGQGEVRVFGRDLRQGAVDLVLPVGPGQSGSFLQASDADRIVVRYAGGRLSAQARRADGRTVELAARDLRDLQAQDIRVSVTAGDGPRAAFLISGYRTVARDTIGPTQNLFAGQLPDEMMRAGVVVQTDTYARAPQARARGRVPLERAGYLFARGRRPDSAEGWFIVDLAASKSVVARSFVPGGQEIRPLSMSEHSASGTRSIPYTPGGATGPIAAVIGGTTFPALAFGDLRLTDVEAMVLEQMPDGFGRPVAGILGMDVLRGCERLRLDLPAEGARGTLELSSAPGEGTPTAETPFSWVASHLIVRGMLEGAPARWILDSGSPRTVVDSVGAPPLRPTATPAHGDTLRGLGGAAMRTTHARAGALAVGALEHRDVECDVAPLPVFAPFREPGYALGVLGLAEIARCRRVELDFARGVVRWFR